MTHGSPLTRRKILAAIGGVGLLAAGPRVAGAFRQDPSFTQYTYAQSAEGGPDLRVAWYERYNGVLAEESNRFTGGAPLTDTADSFNESGDAGRFVDVTGMAPDTVAPGPVLSIPNALPGDQGLLLIGLRAENAPARVWIGATYTAAENGVTEPERHDDDTVGGDLQDHVDVELWYDTGRGGLGGCNGLRDFTEEAVVDAGTLADVGDALRGGVPLDFGVVGDPCIDAGGQRCLALRWSIDPGVNDVIQSDSVQFDLSVVAMPCDDTSNPFEDGAL
jgi:hypothetical protein